MPNVTFLCPYCDHTDRADWSFSESTEIRCPACDVVLCAQTPIVDVGAKQDRASELNAERMSELNSSEEAPMGSELQACVICGSQELFVRKDFPQRLGVTIVVLGFGLSIVTWNYRWVISTFAILFATALVDFLLYLFMGNLLECYRCHAQYRGLPSLNGHEAFDLEIHERHRQQKIRMKEHAAVAPSQGHTSTS